MAVWHRLGEAAGALTPGACAFPPDRGSRGPFKQALAHEPRGPHLGLQFPRQATASWVAPPVLPPAGPSDICPPGPDHRRSQDLPHSTQSPALYPWGAEQERCLAPSLSLRLCSLLCPFLLPSPCGLVLG